MLQKLSAIFVFIFVILLAACGQEVVNPPVKPLTATAEQVESLYGVQAGELTVESRELELVIGDNELLLKAFFPQQQGKYPLLIFSHGNWSDFNKYDNLINHWVSHGYVVLAPHHADGGGMARGIFNSLRYGNLGMIQRRTNDFTLILDNLPTIEQELPELAGKIDANNIAATGHSFGAFTAQQMLGAGAYEPDEDKWHYAKDPRIKAVVAISPPGPMFDEITKDSWRKMTGPVLVTTGTWDTNPTFWPEWQLHKMSYDTAVAGGQYALVVEGADHYLGNLICRPEREEAPQQDALKMVQSVSTAFLDAYLKDDQQAKVFVGGDGLQEVVGEFVTFSRR
jgi:predicted dienelactone hydrolase